MHFYRRAAGTTWKRSARTESARPSRIQNPSFFRDANDLSNRTKSMIKFPKRTLVLSLSCSLAIAGVPVGANAAPDQTAAPGSVAAGQQSNAVQLDQLVA